MSEPVRIEVLLRESDARLPSRSRESDAGYDLHSLVDVAIEPGTVVDINTGMACVAPAGYYFTIEGRSSLFRHGIIPFRSIIDGGYTGDMIFSLMNVGLSTYYVLKGDRVAQLVPHQIVPIWFDKVEEISDQYDIRGDKGFGSSGR